MPVISVQWCVAVSACVCSASSILCLLFCVVSALLLVFSRHVTSSPSPGLQSYFPQVHNVGLCHLYVTIFQASQACLLIQVVLNLPVGNWQD